MPVECRAVAKSRVNGHIDVDPVSPTRLDPWTRIRIVDDFRVGEEETVGINLVWTHCDVIDAINADWHMSLVVGIYAKDPPLAIFEPTSAVGWIRALSPANHFRVITGKPIFVSAWRTEYRPWEVLISVRRVVNWGHIVVINRRVLEEFLYTRVLIRRPNRRDLMILRYWGLVRVGQLSVCSGVRRLRVRDDIGSRSKRILLVRLLKGRESEHAENFGETRPESFHQLHVGDNSSAVSLIL